MVQILPCLGAPEGPASHILGVSPSAQSICRTQALDQQAHTLGEIVQSPGLWPQRSGERPPIPCCL